MVIALRSLKIARGGEAADVEAREMVAEKIDAAISLGNKAVTGALGVTATSAAAKTLAHYRRRVNANRRRLTRK